LEKGRLGKNGSVAEESKHHRQNARSPRCREALANSKTDISLGHQYVRALEKAGRKQQAKFWISKETIKALRKKDQLHRKWRISQSQAARSSFEKARKVCKKQIAKDRRRWISIAFQSDNVHNFWSQVRRLTKPRMINDIPNLREGDKVARTESEKAEFMKTHFQKVWSCEDSIPLKDHGPGEFHECTPIWVY
jgi:hypothetical protein